MGIIFLKFRIQKAYMKSIQIVFPSKFHAFFFNSSFAIKHEAVRLIKGCLLFLCMQHLLFNWCWWFFSFCSFYTISFMQYPTEFIWLLFFLRHNQNWSNTQKCHVLIMLFFPLAIFWLLFIKQIWTNTYSFRYKNGQREPKG